MVSARQYKHISQKKKLESTSDVENLLLFLKDLVSGATKILWLEQAANCLENYIDEKEEGLEPDPLLRKVSFVRDQLSLIEEHPIREDFPRKQLFLHS